MFLLANFELIAEKSALRVTPQPKAHYSMLWNEMVEVDCPFSKI